ncbi:MAG: YtxH domain-containing protein [Saprospiraceae bacterium]
MSKKNEFLNLVGGIFIGAAVGILLAPESGNKTRKKLKKKFDEIKDNAVDYGESKASELLHKTDKYVDELKTKIKNLEDQINYQKEKFEKEL